MPSVVEGAVYSPWTFNLYAFDADWHEVECLRRTNISVNVCTSWLQSWKNVKAMLEEVKTPWMIEMRKVAAVTVEVNCG